eukprot:PLAT8016.1.p1 GENE.PLAT8016.1~~PLAT8016.1.p1  ORF type:complete len:523 (-),score=180.59 PLAT8016.1:59-1627(-)
MSSPRARGAAGLAPCLSLLSTSVFVAELSRSMVVASLAPHVLSLTNDWRAVGLAYALHAVGRFIGGFSVAMLSRTAGFRTAMRACCALLACAALTQAAAGGALPALAAARLLSGCGSALRALAFLLTSKLLPAEEAAEWRRGCRGTQLAAFAVGPLAPLLLRSLLPLANRAIALLTGQASMLAASAGDSGAAAAPSAASHVSLLSAAAAVQLCAALLLLAATDGRMPEQPVVTASRDGEVVVLGAADAGGATGSRMRAAARLLLLFPSLFAMFETVAAGLASMAFHVDPSPLLFAALGCVAFVIHRTLCKRIVMLDAAMVAQVGIMLAGLACGMLLQRVDSAETNEIALASLSLFWAVAFPIGSVATHALSSQPCEGRRDSQPQLASVLREDAAQACAAIAGGVGVQLHSAAAVFISACVLLFAAAITLCAKWNTLPLAPLPPLADKDTLSMEVPSVHSSHASLLLEEEEEGQPMARPPAAAARAAAAAEAAASASGENVMFLSSYMHVLASRRGGPLPLSR